ncbi:MAG: metallophosphoesterase, partial [bacterium]
LLSEILPWLLKIDFIKLPFFPLYKKFKATWLDIQYRVIIALFLLFSIYVLCKVIADTTRIRVSETILTYRHLPRSFGSLTIAHISDVQADARTGKRKIKRYVKKVNKLRPDIIFFTGDLVTSGKKYIEAGANVLRNFEAQYGIYACLGDHDYWADENKVIHSLNYNGIKSLEDTNQFIRVGNDSLLVTFVTNIYNKRPSLDKLNLLMGQQPRGILDIIVTHQPSESLIELAAERGYHLFLAGHTHGGQIIFRPFGIEITPPRMESPFYKGTYRVGRMLVSVNSGLGLTLAPLRYNAPAEITLIKIMPAI